MSTMVHGSRLESPSPTIKTVEERGKMGDGIVDDEEEDREAGWGSG